MPESGFYQRKQDLYSFQAYALLSDRDLPESPRLSGNYARLSCHHNTLYYICQVQNIKGHEPKKPYSLFLKSGAVS